MNSILENTEQTLLGILTKNFGFTSVDEMLSTVIIDHFSAIYDWDIKPEDSKKFARKLQKELTKNPESRFIDLLKTWNKSMIETEKVTLKIPKNMMNFLREKRKTDLDKYLSECIVDMVIADIDAGSYSDPEDIKKEYGLTGNLQ